MDFPENIKVFIFIQMSLLIIVVVVPRDLHFGLPGCGLKYSVKTSLALRVLFFCVSSILQFQNFYQKFLYFQARVLAIL